MTFLPKNIPDISFYQDDNTTPQGVDFAKMRMQCEEVIIRAGQNTWVDSDFATNWRASKAAGLKRGTYWFYDSRTSPEQQADLWRGAVGGDLPELGLWVDLEESYGGQYKGESNYKRFVEAVRSRFPGVVGIYTAKWWWDGQGFIQNDYWASFPLWCAQYSTSLTLIPRPWAIKGAVLWQYTSTGNGALYGVESLGIDLNHPTQVFYDLFGGTPPPPGGTMEQWKITWADGARLRTGPGIGFPAAPITNNILAVNTIVNVQKKQINTANIDEWAQHENGYWFATIYSGQVRAVNVTPPPPPPPVKVALVSGGLDYNVTTGELTAFARYADGSELKNVYPKEKQT